MINIIYNDNERTWYVFDSDGDGYASFGEFEAMTAYVKGLLK